MYVRPKMLWWLIPIFLSLFCVGIALGTAGNRSHTEGKAVMEPVDRGKNNLSTLSALLDQLTKEEERSFVVYLQDYALNGRYQQERFSLSGDVGGHKLEISRDEQEKVVVRIDGQIQDHTSLPYALYTPNEHAALLKSVLRSVAPTSIQDPSGQGWRGYRVSVPAQEVTSLMSIWLGPSFPINDLTPDLAKRISVDYQLWYDPESGEVQQLEIDMQIRNSIGVKRDQLRFRL